MSPRAAWRLEALGYTDVRDYTGGKADWRAAGLPTEGHLQRLPSVATAMDPAVLTCTPGESLHDVVAQMDRTGAAVCVVVNEQRVVQGRLRRDRVDPAEGRSVEDVMELGPATVRADAPLAETIERMRSRRVRSIIVSTPEGVLLGVVFAEPAETHPAATQ